ncbi:MAG: helix-turn-helix transcriptional regulator [Silvanigrellaceae bacterium]|nr:helix-turn-helix transcriptional regulator [Silvanigrellaceae bacterium]
MEFAHKIKEIRENKGLSKTEFSKILGLSESTLSQYERGGRSPSVEILLKISNKLSVSCDYLLGVNDINNDILYGLKESDLNVVLKLIEVLRNR